MTLETFLYTPARRYCETLTCLERLKREMFSYQAQDTFFISHNNSDRCHAGVLLSALPTVQMLFFIKAVLSPGVTHTPPSFSFGFVGSTILSNLYRV